MTDRVFKLTEAEADQVVQALAKRPFEESAVLIAKLQAQYQEQITATNAKPSKKT